MTQVVALVEPLLRTRSADRGQPRVRIGAIGVGKAVRVVGRRIGHTRRLQHVIADIILPSLPGHRFDQLPGNHVEDVVIGEAAAEAGLGLQEADAAHRLGTRQVAARHEQQVALPQPQPAAMRQQIADRHLAGDPVIVHLKAGEAIDHLVVPADPAGID